MRRAARITHGCGADLRNPFFSAGKSQACKSAHNNTPKKVSGVSQNVNTEHARPAEVLRFGS